LIEQHDALTRNPLRTTTRVVSYVTKLGSAVVGPRACPTGRTGQERRGSANILEPALAKPKLRRRRDPQPNRRAHRRLDAMNAGSRAQRNPQRFFRLPDIAPCAGEGPNVH
jgi:hypothetical protein